jgi:hypothetical protein
VLRQRVSRESKGSGCYVDFIGMKSVHIAKEPRDASGKAARHIITTSAPKTLGEASSSSQLASENRVLAGDPVRERMPVPR